MDGSAQCKSSHTARMGCRSASSSSHATRASCVFLATHQGRKAGRPGDVQTALGRTFPKHAIHLDRYHDTLEVVGTQLLGGKVAAHQAEGGCADDDRIRPAK